MVKNAIRTAARLGLLTVEERRREGRRNLPNVIRIVSKDSHMPQRVCGPRAVVHSRERERRQRRLNCGRGARGLLGDPATAIRSCAGTHTDR